MNKNLLVIYNHLKKTKHLYIIYRSLYKYIKYYKLIRINIKNGYIKKIFYNNYKIKNISFYSLYNNYYYINNYIYIYNVSKNNNINKLNQDLDLVSYFKIIYSLTP